jgi:hypothetical protein
MESAAKTPVKTLIRPKPIKQSKQELPKLNRITPISKGTSNVLVSLQQINRKVSKRDIRVTPGFLQTMYVT